MALAISETPSSLLPAAYHAAHRFRKFDLFKSMRRFIMRNEFDEKLKPGVRGVEKTIVDSGNKQRTAIVSYSTSGHRSV